MNAHDTALNAYAYYGITTPEDERAAGELESEGRMHKENKLNLGLIRSSDFLPPLLLMETWRNQGLTAQEIRAKVDEYQRLVIENILGKAEPKKVKAEPKKAKPGNFRLNKRTGPPIPKPELESSCQKHSLNEVGRMYGVSKTTIVAWLAIYGLSKKEIDKRTDNT